MNNRQIKNSGCLLLSGGQSRRMGTDKARVTINGRTFLQIMADKLYETGMPCYLSLAARQQEVPEGFTAVYDEIRDPEGIFAGPMGGLYTALKQAAKDGLNGLYVVPVDAPLFETKLFERFGDGEQDLFDIQVFSDTKGRFQPLFGYYRTGIINQIEELVSVRDYKLRSLLRHPSVHTRVIPLMDQSEERMVSNINDPEAYAALLGSLSTGKTHLFLQGQRGCGKTTMIRNAIVQTDLSVGGFATRAVQDPLTGEREIRMYPSRLLKEAQDQINTAIQYGVLVGTADHGIKTVRTDVFDSYGCALLQEAEKAQMIVMDELGTMETGADLFTQAVRKVLDQEIPVLGALKAAEINSEFLAAVRTHDNVEVIELSEQNREEVTVRLQQWLDRFTEGRHET